MKSPDFLTETTPPFRQFYMRRAEYALQNEPARVLRFRFLNERRYQEGSPAMKSMRVNQRLAFAMKQRVLFQQKIAGTPYYISIPSVFTAR